MSQTKKPRVDRNAVFTEAENKKLIALHLENREQFHGKFKSGRYSFFTESLEKKKYMGTGGEALAEKHHIAGVPGLDEESDGELEYKSDDALVPNGLGTSFGPITIRDVIGEEEEVVLDDSPETFEEGRKKPATTDLALSKL
ncbi:unnamed protein product [Cylicocyclus nassatus]|uniref:Uncharacterized protein n=1 Tax=Cylicocyclus nassatus TaxID=53992 RepID=A0AA36M6A6_CYLNA|nr:unnamed protein product [Cylicocyclus nassatus]